ncbi:MAG: Sulfite reductase, partial [Cyanobacteriota bacterium]
QYQLWLGGTPNLSRLAEPYLEKMPLQDLEATLEPLLKAWHQGGGRRSFGDFVVKTGRPEIEALLAAAP